MNNRYVFDCPLPVNRLIAGIGNKMQISTQRYDRRPFGVGLLVAGYDVSYIYSILSFNAFAVRTIIDLPDKTIAIYNTI